jgi:hypothetical protein
LRRVFQGAGVAQPGGRGWLQRALQGQQHSRRRTWLSLVFAGVTQAQAAAAQMPLTRDASRTSFV